MRLVQIALAVGLGLLALVAYFFPLGPLAALQWALYDWAAVLVAAAWVLGLFHLAHHHWRGLIRRRADWPARLVLLVALLVTFAAVLWSSGSSRPVESWLLEYILIPGAASLMAVAAVVLVYRGLWVLQRRRDPLAWAFAGGVLLFLLLDVLYGVTGKEMWAQTSAALQRWLVTPALRGVLLGLALGLMSTAWRLLWGVDRPYVDE